MTEMTINLNLQPFRKFTSCQKCLSQSIKVEWGSSPAEGIAEHLGCTCERCGFSWNMCCAGQKAEG